MLFNSLEFAIFLPLVFAGYWFVVNRRLWLQNLFVVAASYFFYGWWDPLFLSLIALSSLADYLIGLSIHRTNLRRGRIALLSLSLAVNLGVLAVFKYYNFFMDSFVGAFALFGVRLEESTLDVVLPVGISFYTFQTLSYTIDVYRRRITPTRDIIAFFAFVSFFPQLVAGPIERGKHLLPQFQKPRVFDSEAAADGMRQILLGLFKKVVVADTLAHIVDETFTRYAELSGSTLLLGGVFFAFQIYCDFSGYSDIAIGTSRLFGFSLMRNFAFPYFSRDVAEFWRRWHISLTTWFRDYLYIPLGGSRGSRRTTLRNIFIVFIVSGLWHGASWTFVAWGLFNALLFLPLLLAKKNRAHLDTVAGGRVLPAFGDWLRMTATFLLVVVAWVFFRAESIAHAGAYLKRMFSASLFSVPDIVPSHKAIVLLPLGLLVVGEWVQREREHALELHSLPPVWRRLIYVVVFFLIFFLGDFGANRFIYFQF